MALSRTRHPIRVISKVSTLILMILHLTTDLPAVAGEKGRDADPIQAAEKPEAPPNAALAPALEKRDKAKQLCDKASYAASLPLYRESLALVARDSFPETWAMIQMDLGMALYLAASVATSEGNPEEGDRLLVEAITAYRSAQEIFSKEASPVEWSSAQTYIAHALACRNQSQSGNDSNADGVAAQREVLKVLTLLKHPKEWAAAQASLGNLLYHQAVFTGRKEAQILLGESLKALSAATEVRTRETMPEEWGRAQIDFGQVFNAYSKYGTPSEKRDHLKTAEQHLLAAVEVLKAGNSALTSMAEHELEETRSRIRSLDKSK